MSLKETEDFRSTPANAEEYIAVQNSEIKLDNSNLLDVSTHILHVALNPDHTPTLSDKKSTEARYAVFLLTFVRYALRFFATDIEGITLVNGYFTPRHSGIPAKHPVWEAFKKFVNSLSGDQLRSMQLSVPNVDRLSKAIASNRSPHLPALRHHKFKVR